MAKADHLYVSYGCFTHHGIDLGDGTVVHLSRARGCVCHEPLEQFAAGRVVRVHDWASADEPDVVVQRAGQSVGIVGYDLVRGNCEHFASWCKTGRADSRQVVRVVNRLAAPGGRWMARPAAVGVAQLTGKSLFRSVSPALLAVDAAQFGVEMLLSHRGVPTDKVEAAGASIGFVGSLAVGSAIAGPVGAGVSVGLWAIGEMVGRYVSRPPSRCWNTLLAGSS